MQLRPLLPLVPVVAGSGPALGRARQRLTVEAGGRGLRVASLGQAQDDAQTLEDGGEAAGCGPARGLLVDRFPGRQIVGQHAPGGAGPHQPAQGGEDLAQVVTALGGLGGQQGEVGGHDGPLGIGDVTGIGAARWRGVRFHNAKDASPTPQVPNRL